MHRIFLITIRNHKPKLFKDKEIFYSCFPEHFLLHRFKYSCLIMLPMTSPRQDCAFCQSKFYSDIKMILCCSCNNEVSLLWHWKGRELCQTGLTLFGGYMSFLLHQCPKPGTKNALASPREFAIHNLKKQQVNNAAMEGKSGGSVAELKQCGGIVPGP